METIKCEFFSIRPNLETGKMQLCIFQKTSSDSVKMAFEKLIAFETGGFLIILPDNTEVRLETGH